MMGTEAKLAGMAAIVTGGSGASGSESALRLMEDGAAVLLMGRRADILQRAKAKLLEAVPDGTVALFSGDASHVDDVQAALDKAYAMRNRLDIIVAGVGKSDFRPILMHDL